MKKMKRYGLYITLFAMLTACSDYQQEIELPSDLSDYIVTGSIVSIDTSARLADKNNQTIFQSGDPVFIGWGNGSRSTTSYQYIYSGENGIFHPAEDNANYSLWKDLITNAGSSTEIYAWYGGTNCNTLPAVGSDITVPSNQALESVYLSAICMGAHTSVASPAVCKTLNFEFNHLLACLKVHVRIDDKAVTPADVIGSSAVITGLKTTGKIALDAASGYILSTENATTGDIQMYQCPWSDQDPFLIDFKCLVPPQTLSAGQQIVVTLANGKKYICSLGDSNTNLQAGKETYLNIEIAAKEGVSVFTPVCTMFPVMGGAFSGNRIFCTEKVGEKTGFRIYDKRPDGSWGTGEPVYTDENGTTVFLASGGGSLNIYGDYAVTSFDGSTHFIKKSKTTGKWFYAKGNFPFSGYATAISQNFLATGNHVDDKQNRTYIYPIDENGNLGTGYIVTNISGYKMSLVDNILATNSGVYQYNESTQKWDVLHSWGMRSTRRISTDGKRIIVQNGSDRSNVQIFRVDAVNKKIIEEGWEGSPAQAGVGVPIGIYGNYALSGGENTNSSKNWLDISYRNPETGEWKNLGSFLPLMKRADPTITAASLKGNSISLKGTRALITSDGVVYFVENIDKMVEDWIANLPASN